MADHLHENCQALLGSLSEYIDGELPADLCREIEKHLEGCTNCRVVLNTTKRTIDLVQIPVQEEAIPEDMRERLFKRLHLDDYLNPIP
ncbi:MAG TPA: zf-HC2 domain-containing protein [Anaerolineales bacterium]|nr:zf-HC2 domain-containing protein [Anaerolineales bacterium]HNA88153.1 zf-HC2 domain-containing protein [Anaerolineales bacterium]HNC07902.1 zf-HC2 domain-containing protein [Anaerolineales bacterium]